MRFLSATLGLAIFSLTACASMRPLDKHTSPNITVVEGLPQPEDLNQQADARSFRIGPYDVLTYSFYGIDNTGGEVVVDPSGRVSFPIAGQMMVAGMTAGELEQATIRALQQNYVRNPQVTINVKEVLSQQFTVDGEVKKPGLYPALGNMTLIKAIARSEGTSEFARSDEVVVFRKVKGRQYATLYDLSSIRRGAYDDPSIYADDIIVVGNSNARRLFRDVLSVAPILLTPLTILLTNNN